MFKARKTQLPIIQLKKAIFPDHLEERGGEMRFIRFSSIHLVDNKLFCTFVVGKSRLPF
ncbi:hypothetical protein HMPREF1869_00133 [Bacteroidales bacterium KA00251]|nr:hypothetical protein HMPREF1869_00133 [Bacteroidales bacterium KA00251]